ncbi:hypothetical protein MCEMSE15_01800 [Fimbriimonadaceae bacterium]
MTLQHFEPPIQCVAPPFSNACFRLRMFPSVNIVERFGTGTFAVTEPTQSALTG